MSEIFRPVPVADTMAEGGFATLRCLSANPRTKQGRHVRAAQSACVRQAVSFVAALALLIQVVSAGIEIAPLPPERTGHTAAVHDHDHGSGHHTPGTPTPSPDISHCSWCVLCGKLGVAVGAPPVPDVALLPPAAFLQDAGAVPRECFRGRSYALLPVGARAPPRFV